ncbi:MAG TPA: hypothetical protein P5556_03165 [Candidatus Gastranaerophilales bacterium]|nr:hypothetical protein [Candidatus Gastranaerophilales bacterium]
MDNEQKNDLYKIELLNNNYKTVIIKLYTSRKYQTIPSPIKKDADEYALFLPDTNKNLELTPSITHLKDILEDIKVEYFPLLSQNTGYTKIFITTSNEDVDLFVENHIYVPKKPEPVKIVQKQTVQKAESKPEAQIKVIKPEPVKIAEKQEKQEAKTEPERVEKQIVQKEKLKSEPPKYIIRQVQVKDYSIGLLAAFLLIILNFLIIYLNKIKKAKYDGKLSLELKKKAVAFAENDYILLFSENESMISNVYQYCIKNNINLQIATKNIQEVSNKIEKFENINLNLTEFKFEEFYNHRDFYKKLTSKPVGFIFDIDPKFIKNDFNQGFDFVQLKKYIDLNFTNLFLILFLILKDLENKDGFVIFTDANNKDMTSGSNFLINKIQLSTMNAVDDFVKNVKQIKTAEKTKIHYFLNDLLKS